ncbi:2282_t:CDS:2 [Gigaspora margarita]|uniref:2282_t:CDS:1 n=1 Tax=Gigaspora margarita TaxID=4874 RepID=A0ABN7UMU0_GIGMA|nr:2282_t:CDS:2 [Gigaspora margarita]
MSKGSINVISIFLTYLDENEKNQLTSSEYQAYDEDILPNCQEQLLNLINVQNELNELELKYFSTSINLTNIAPNLEALSINNSFGNPFGEGKNNFHNLQSLELEDNEIELNRIVLKTNQNYPNITTLCYITDNILFSSTLKIFKNLCQLQIGEFAYYDLPYSNQDYLQALVVKLEVLILTFNIEVDLLPNLRKFVEKPNI